MTELNLQNLSLDQLRAQLTAICEELRERKHYVPLTFDRLKKVNGARAMRWHQGGLASWTYNDWITALCGEVGELANLCKKLKRLEDGIPSKRQKEVTIEDIKKKMAEEVADILIYLDLFSTRAGINMEHATIEKFNFVSKKEDFPERL